MQLLSRVHPLFFTQQHCALEVFFKDLSGRDCKFALMLLLFYTLWMICVNILFNLTSGLNFLILVSYNNGFPIYIKTEYPMMNKEYPIMKEKQKRKRILFWISLILLILILCLIGIILWVMASLFDHEPLKVVNKPPNYDTLEEISEKFGIARESDSSKDNISHYATLLMQDVKVVELSGDEVNVLCDASLPLSRIYLEGNIPELTIAGCQFNEGKLIVDCSFESSFSTPFGKYMNMHIVFTPQIWNKHFSLKIHSVSVGSYTIKGGHLQDAVDAEVVKFENSKMGKDVLNLITALCMEKKRVTVIFKPKETLLFLGGQSGTEDLISP